MNDNVRLLVISPQEFRTIESYLTGGGGPQLGGDAQLLHNVLRQGWTITAMTSVEDQIFVTAHKVTH